MGQGKLRRILIGFAVAAVACFIGLMLAGAGHGWSAPFFYSFGLFILYPAVLARNLYAGRKSVLVDVAIVAVAIALDVMLVLDLIGRADGVRWRERELFVPGVDKSMYPFFAVWLVIWFGWQFLAVRSLWRGAGWIKPLPGGED